MTVTEGKGRNGRDTVRITHVSGSSTEVHLSGAQVASWVVDGEEKLFVGSAEAFARGEPIRGGIPVVFPQFANEGPLPAHGFARRSLWTLARSDGSDPSRATFRLSDDAATRALWPHKFDLSLDVLLGAEKLTVELAVENTGEAPFEFTAALHTYFRVADIRRTTLAGLQGCTYLDKTRDKTSVRDSSPELVVQEWTDRVYVNAPRALTLRDGTAGSAIRIESQGFRDAVVWNPWREKVTTFSGMTEDDYLHMICVEAARVGEAVSLQPRARWTASQSLTSAAA